MVNWKFDKQSFWVGQQMHQIHFKGLFGWLMKSNTSVVWNENEISYKCVYHKYTHDSLHVNDYVYLFIKKRDNITLVKIYNYKTQHQKLNPKLNAPHFENNYILH